MPECMVANLAAFLKHPRDDILMIGDPAAQHKERRRTVVFFQRIQNHWRYLAVRPVVIGHRDHRPGWIDDPPMRL